ncbi:MAG TPA: orotate phosphoribosyltransferase [Bacteroidia bacterium]|nr:orotate phosphoribosyltransferase [Bacteroidia bacterium]
MITNAGIASKVAEFLLQIKAVKLQPQQPFTWASGWKSPIYCDNRKTLSYPMIRTYIRQQFVKIIGDNFPTPDVIAGVATGAISHGVLVAEEMGLPFVYIRPEPKKHGLGNMVEGEIKSGQSVIIIEDLISTGGSSLRAVEVLREAGCEVKGMAAIFTYGFPDAIENFRKADVPLITLCDYPSLLRQALKDDFVSDSEIATLEAWRDSPATWGGKQ